MRANTKLPKEQRVGTKRKKESLSETGFVTPDQFKKERKGKGITSNGNSRLCGSLTAFLHHLGSIETRTGAWKCVYCGGDCYTRCGVCGVPAHNNPKTGEHAGKQCFLHLHNDDYYGLARCDSKLLKGKSKKDWTPPSANDVKKNKDHIDRLKKEHPYSLRSNPC